MLSGHLLQSTTKSCVCVCVCVFSKSVVKQVIDILKLWKKLLNNEITAVISKAHELKRRGKPSSYMEIVTFLEKATEITLDSFIWWTAADSL